MGLMGRAWRIFAEVVRTHDKVATFGSALADHQAKLEGVTERVVRLEAMLELLLRTAAGRRLES